MLYLDQSTGSPFAKDPTVVRFAGCYWMYYSHRRTQSPEWTIAIARSDDLEHWTRVGTFAPGTSGPDAMGVAAPGAVGVGDQVHLFYQSYGTGPRDAICVALSVDGVNFTRLADNPIFRPCGRWNCGRAIDASVIVHDDRLWLFCATRDPEMKVQMICTASAPLATHLALESWTDHSLDGPALKPELPWEQHCIEAPTVVRHGDRFFMFYGGAYNVRPQQIGCAVSDDLIHWKRLSDEPLLTHGPAGSWNASESGHPEVFVDPVSGRTWLFYQGSPDGGRRWMLSKAEILWIGGRPVLKPDLVHVGYA